MELQVFDPAMCCATGVCGPSVDPALARFASDLDWLASQGVTVRRFNLGQEPGAFAGSPRVSTLLQQVGTAALPVVMVGDEVKAVGHYPTREELATWTQRTDPQVAATSAAEGCCAPAQSSCC
jgi:hypothetical protein